MNRTSKLKTVSNGNESRETELLNQHLPDCLSLFLSLLSLSLTQSFVLRVIVPHQCVQCVYAGQTPGVHNLVLALLHVHVCFPRGR